MKIFVSDQNVLTSITSGAVPEKAPACPALAPLEIYQNPAELVALVAGIALVVTQLEPPLIREFLGSLLSTNMDELTVLGYVAPVPPVALEAY